MPPTPSPGGAAAGAEFARADAVAGLAREVDGLRRSLGELGSTVDPLTDTPTRVDDLARLVGQLADAVAAVSARPAAAPAPSWLMAPTDPTVVERVLGELCAWLAAVFLRYTDGVTALPECWLLHADVVEELLWLMHAWCVAYQGRTASVQLAGDWHDRQRPGVVRRVKQSAGSCSVERHQTRPEWDQYPAGAAPVPGVDTIAAVAGWWATGRDDPAPEPGQRAGAAEYATNGGRYR